MTTIYRDTETNTIHETHGEGRVAIGNYEQWIEWRGGECPVPHDTQIIAYFRGRRPYVGPAIWPAMASRAKPFMWHHAPSGPRTDPASDSVAYRVRLA